MLFPKSLLTKATPYSFLLRSPTSLRWFSALNIGYGNQDRIIPRWNEGFDPHLDKLDLDNVQPLRYETPINCHLIQYTGKKGVIDLSKTPVIFLHGLFGSTQNFRSAARILSTLTKRKMCAMDLRNHGDSPKRAPHDYETMARDVIHTLTLNDYNEVILVGHSMGAKVAMLVSLLAPKMIQKLVVIDNSPINQALDPMFYQQLIGLCHVERQVPAINSRHHKDLHMKDVLIEADKVLQQYEPDKLNRFFLLSGLRTNSKTRVKVPVFHFLLNNVLDEMGKWPNDLVDGLTYKNPVKVMKAKKSLFIHPSHIDNSFSKYFDHIQYEEFNTGHWLVSDDPEAFISSMKEFIDPEETSEPSNS